MLTILIADDEAFGLKLIRDTLSIIPTVSFVEAEDGVSAVEQTRRYQPRLLILDIMIPKMNGVEVCRLLKADAAFKNIPVILITASADPAHRVIAHQVGADGFIRKPFGESELLGTVMRVLQLAEVGKR